MWKSGGRSKLRRPFADDTEKWAVVPRFAGMKANLRLTRSTARAVAAALVTT
jgi:hypothetical protein